MGERERAVELARVAIVYTDSLLADGYDPHALTLLHLDEHRALATALLASQSELEHMRCVVEAAARVVDERMAAIRHARESTAMCRLYRALAARARATTPPQATEDE